MTPEGKKQLISDEGIRLQIYDDKTGKDVGALLSGGTPSIGIGRNLARGITTAEANYLFENDVLEVENYLKKFYIWLKPDTVTWDVCCMVEFNTGKLNQFTKMLQAMKYNDTKTATQELLNSIAARELPERYKRMTSALLNGRW